ncbi:MAG: hypothetical protein M0Z56_03680 [Desulfobacteraceae bacterium]|nr:hypothetical protein [Desulfobacteraceae bacterium]
MNDKQSPSLEELEQRRARSLLVSEKAVAEYPDVYREIKKMVLAVIQTPLEIGDYYKTARKLAVLLEKLARTDANSLFYYFAKNIDPLKCGRAMYFRADCLDLREQLKCIDELRASSHHIRLIGRKNPSPKDENLPFDSAP